MEKKFKCPNCLDIFLSINSLSNHWTKKYKSSIKDLYCKINQIYIDPVCACGCDSKVRFIDFSRGFSKFILGHASRVKNNFQSEKSKSNSLKTRKNMLISGEWKPFVKNETGNVWNAGQTKESDIRIANLISKRDTPEYKKISSERMKENRLNGKIPNQYGLNHSNWKGGISPLLNFCHSNKKLFNEWKYPILLKNNFTCSSCNRKNEAGSSIDLHVHHDKVLMSEIVRKISEKFGWENNFATHTQENHNLFELKIKISDAVAEYHIINNISGIVLCKDCHKLEHEKFNF